MNKKKKCPHCNKGQLDKVEDVVSDIDGIIFIEKGERCNSCGEEFISEKEGQKMIRIAKRMNLWGEPLKLHRKLSRSGRGTVLRIPSDIEDNLGLKGEEKVAISKMGKKRILVEILS